MYKHILIPTDGSELAGHAAGLALVLLAVARASGVRWSLGEHASAFGLCALASIATLLVIAASFGFQERLLLLGLTLILMTLGVWRFGLSAWEASIATKLLRFRMPRAE